MIMNFANINWGTLDNKIYSVLLFIIILFLVIRSQRVFKVCRKLGGNRLLQNFSRTRFIIKCLLFVLSAIFLLIALLSPQWGATDNVKQEGRDIVVALDVSKSMLAQDDQPNRLEFAKNKIKKFVNMVDTDRVGLVLFSGDAFVQVPLTRDLDSFLSFLDQVDVESISGGSTDIQKAIEKSTDMFEAYKIDNKRLLVLFTDGEDFSKNVEKNQDKNLAIFTVGLGSKEGAPIPFYDDRGIQNGHIKKNDGSIVISKLNEQNLMNLSRSTGGKYIKSSIDDSDLNYIIDTLKYYEKHEFGSRQFDIYENQYPYFIFISFVFLLIEWIL